MNRIIIAATICLVLFSGATAQSEVKQSKNQYSIVFGLTQPLILKGFNVEANLWTEKMVFDYSHGFNLHIDGASLGKDFEKQKINFKITHSLGFGIGYRFTKGFNLRFEPKMHIYETYYNGKGQVNSNSITHFTTYTLGLGAYYRIMPFQRKENALKGITIVPSIRYWQKVGSTLKDNQFNYYNSETKQNESFKAPNVGMVNTPFFVNISIGYTF